MQEAEHGLAQEFLTALQAVIGLNIVEQRQGEPFPQDPRRRLDALLRVQVLHDVSVVALAVEVVKEAYPRDARRLIEYLAEFQGQQRQLGDTSVIPVVVARYLTASARAVFRGVGVNYFESSSGTLYFRYKTWLIDIERPSKHPVTRRVGSVFNGAREQVVHALLIHWLRAGEGVWLGGNELAALADTSAFTVSKTLQELEKFDWVETSGAGPSQRRRLAKPCALLDAWADEWLHRSRKESRTRCYTYAGGRGGIVDRMLEKLANHHGWAITGAAAANTRVPHLTSVDRVHIVVPPGLAETWAEELGLDRVDKGSNITLIERAGASLMFLDEHPERPGSRFTSPFVQYLDLLDGVGRNKELAREYRSQILMMGDQ